MDKFQDILMKVGVFAAENRYLSSIKNAFQTFVPFTIIGAIGVLWSNVICNHGIRGLSTSGNEFKFFKPSF